MKNLQNKTRDVEKPYAVFRAGNWEWRVLKRYQSRDAEKKNEYARWMCAVKSPHTYGSWEFGDVYVDQIPMATRGMAIGGDDGIYCLQVIDVAAKINDLVLDPKAWG